jgi:hypothetical protein
LQVRRRLGDDDRIADHRRVVAFERMVAERHAAENVGRAADRETGSPTLAARRGSGRRVPRSLRSGLRVLKPAPLRIGAADALLGEIDAPA